MASVLLPCYVCGLGVRFDPNQTEMPEVVVCESYECRAEVARQSRVNAPQPVEDEKPGKGPKNDKPEKGKGTK